MTQFINQSCWLGLFPAIAHCISSALQLPFATFDLLQMRDTAGQAHKLGNARPRREHLICMIRATSFVDIIQVSADVRDVSGCLYKRLFKLTCFVTDAGTPP